MTVPVQTQVMLRDMIDTDLPIFFENQLDPDANYMAAFTAKDPTDRDAFMAHWDRIRADPTITIKTILYNGAAIGSVSCHSAFGEPEVSYSIGKPYWGRGIMTRALHLFLDIVTVRPLHARAVKDNIGSLRVLEKCGFKIIGEERGFANARGAEVDEVLLVLA